MRRENERRKYVSFTADELTESYISRNDIWFDALQASYGARKFDVNEEQVNCNL